MAPHVWIGFVAELLALCLAPRLIHLSTVMLITKKITRTLFMIYFCYSLYTFINSKIFYLERLFTNFLHFIAFTRPFTLRVHFNDVEMSDRLAPDQNNRGFCLDYVQQPCPQSG